MTRADLLSFVVEHLPIPSPDGSAVFVGIDGVDGAGKTVLADDLVPYLQPQTNVVRVSIDGFHNVRGTRYRRGRQSPDGFWLDSYDYDAFRKAVVVPFRRGRGTYVRASYDLENDSILDGPKLPVIPGTLVLVDGIFLHRPELRDVWDFSLFLQVLFGESLRRLALRDGSSPDPSATDNQRYVGGQKIYLAECDPASRASLVIDYTDLENPKILKARKRES